MSRARVCGLGWRVAICIGGALPALGGCAVKQQSFNTPEDAVGAMVGALRPEVNEERLREVFGSEIEEARSGDEVADREAREEFLAKYDAGHRIVARDDGSRILEIGKDNWPFAFPLIESEGKWMFDTEAGIDELNNRRIGANELDMIQTCLAIVDAQREYALLDPDGDGIHEYAQKAVSDEGKRNGLYWPTAEGEPPSPLGDLVAEATEEGYGRGAGVYHGYRLKLLTAQGPGAPGGAMDYLAKGKLIGGFGVLAWPATYGSSGLKSFIVNQDGIVYEKDLGDDTERLARAMKVFDPAGWERSATDQAN